MTQSELGTPHGGDRVPGNAGGVVVEVTDILRDYLATDSRFTPEIAIERVRTVINSEAGMAAFVNDALHPSEAEADAVVADLAEALDRPGSEPEQLVLELIRIIESPPAVEVYERTALA